MSTKIKFFGRWMSRNGGGCGNFWKNAMSQAAKLDLIRDLKDRVQQIESSQRRALKADCISTGCEAFDQLLPGPGFECGTLTEWFNAGAASGAATLALVVASRALQQGGACVVIDGAGEFYPPAADSLGI